MTNERLYKGKATGTIESLNELEIKHKNGWVYGYYVDGYIVSGIMEATEEYLAHEQWAKVHPDSVGQSIGEKDKNGVEIYRGDIVACGDGEVPTEIRWNDEDHTFYAYNIRRKEHHRLDRHFMRYIGEVIGNIYDNPELLEV